METSDRTRDPNPHHTPALPAAPTAADATARGTMLAGDWNLLDGAASPGGPGLWPLLGLIALAFGAMAFGGWAVSRSSKPMPVGPFAGETAAQSAPQGVMVHVAGRVWKPGVYRLPDGARVQDAIKKAGGPLPGADLNALNLAAWAEDASKIEVPAKAAPAPARSAAVDSAEPVAGPEEPPAAAPNEMLALSPREAPALSAVAPSAPHTAPARKPPAKAKPRSASDGLPHERTPSGAASSKVAATYLARNPVNLNTATLEQLQLLPGVGPKMAERIVAYRQENGAFRAIDDLDNVKGIGEKKMEKLRLLVKVN